MRLGLGSWRWNFAALLWWGNRQGWDCKSSKISFPYSILFPGRVEVSSLKDLIEMLVAKKVFLCCHFQITWISFYESILSSYSICNVSVIYCNNRTMCFLTMSVYLYISCSFFFKYSFMFTRIKFHRIQQ